MKQTIRIEDKDRNGILIGLPRLLDVFEPEGSQMYWAMFDLWITGDFGEGKSILDLEQKSQSAPKGVCVAWRELRDFAESVTQVIDGIIVGCNDSNSIPDRPISDALPQCRVVIKAVDSSFWELTVDEDDLIKRLQHAFPAARRIASGA